MILDIYDYVDDIPIYIRPRNLYDKIKEIPPFLLRKKYRCFISENARWKSRVKSIIHNEVLDSNNYNIKLVKIVVMGRAKSNKDKILAENKLKSNNIKTNPYGIGSDTCFGFYTNDFNNLSKIVREIKNEIDGVSIINTIWYIKYDIMLNLRKLIDVGFTPRQEKKFKAVLGVVNYSTIRLFYNGTIGVYAPHTKNSIEILRKNIYHLLNDVGAII